MLCAAGLLRRPSASTAAAPSAASTAAAPAGGGGGGGGECKITIYSPYSYVWIAAIDYVDIAVETAFVVAYGGLSDHDWNWSGSPNVTVEQDAAFPNRASVTLDGTGPAWVKIDRGCIDAWEFIIADSSLDIDAPDIDHPTNPNSPQIKLLWSNAEDEDRDGLLDAWLTESDAEIEDGVHDGQAEARDVEPGPLVPDVSGEFSASRWAIWRPVVGVRIWTLASENVLNDAWNGPCTPQVSKTINGSLYHELPSGLYINGPPPTDKTLLVEGHKPGYASVRYAFWGDYFEEETQRPMGFLTYRSRPVVVAQLEVHDLRHWQPVWNDQTGQVAIENQDFFTPIGETEGRARSRMVRACASSASRRISAILHWKWKRGGGARTTRVRRPLWERCTL